MSRQLLDPFTQWPWSCDLSEHVLCLSHGPTYFTHPHTQVALDVTWPPLLHTSPHTQVALELLALAAEQGLGSWASSTLNGKKFKLVGTSKLMVGCGNEKCFFRCLAR